MTSGVAYQFCYTPEERTYWIEPCEDSAGTANGLAAAGGGGSTDTASAGDRRQLPETVIFAEGRVERESTETNGTDETTSNDTQPQSSGDSGANVPVVFSPDGTCSSAEVTLRNENDRTVTLSIHGLTSIAVVGEVTSAEETSL